MKTAVAPNSLISYWSMRDAGELQPKEVQVLEALKSHGPMTREQIALRAGMKESGACGRVKSLLEKGLIVPAGSCMNPATKKPNEIVRLVAAEPQQLGLPEVA